MTVSQCVWLSGCGRIRLGLAMFERVWPCRAVPVVFGIDWSSPVVFGCVWSCPVVSNSVLVEFERVELPLTAFD